MPAKTNIGITGVSLLSVPTKLGEAKSWIVPLTCVIRVHTIVWVLGCVGGVAGYVEDCAHDGHVGGVGGVGAWVERIATKLAGLSLIPQCKDVELIG